MERRLLSAFLAVMMVLTMAPVAFAADTSVDSYDSLVEAINSASDGDTITLNGDIDVQRTLVVTKKLTLDLAGHKLYNTKDLWDAPTEKDNNWSLISVRENGDLTITGNGTLDAKKDDCYAVDVQDETAKATLENGTFVGNITTVYVFEGTLVVKDGSYSIKQLNSNGVQNQYGLTINCYDQNYKNGTAKVLITGGTFAHFNPVDNAAEGTGTNFATSGYETVEGTDGLYTAQVKSDNAAAIDDVQYATLADAVAAANNGDTVTLLKNTVEDVVIPAGKTITLDLNGKKIVNSTTAQDSKVADDARKHTITNNGTLTIMDSVGGGVVDNVSHGRAALYNNGTITEIKGGKFTRSVDNSTDSESANGNSWYVVYNAEGATISKISNGEFLALGHFSSLFSNCGTIDEISGGTFTQDHFIAFKNEGTVNKISGGVFSSTDESCIQNWGTIGEICGGTITAGSLGIWNFSSDEYKSNGTVEKISDGVISGTKAAIRLSNYDVEYLNKSADSLKNWASTTIVGGKINGALKVGNGTSVSISGGYFTVDPTEYLATYTDADKKYIAKAVTGDYKFHVELADKNDLQVVPVAGATSAPSKEELKNNKDIPSDQVDNIVTAAKAVSAPEISKAAQEVAANISDNSNTLGKQYQDAAKNEVPNQEKIEVRTYLDVEPKAYNKSAYTLDITPKYDVVVVGTKNGATAKKVVASDTLKVTNATNVSIQLPADFVENTDTLYVQHKGHEYDAAVTANNGVYTANFTNPHGFSPFTISKTSQTVATIGTDKYTSFADAVSAVPANGTIEITGGTSPYTGTANKTFTVSNKTSAEITVNGQKIAKDGSYTFKYTSSSSSGGSSSGKTTYKVTTSAVNNGGVNASPSNAEKGATITITLSPDKGYKLDKLTVTDGSGKTVSTVKKSDTVYTFTMPASAVKVGVSYVKATETPSKTKFNDVSANDWFASAVDYVTGKGMMNGTADNTFSPKANTTRGMVVTVLYRLENQPSTSAASFTDVASGAYYANAVAWANANGIVSGYGSGKFGPNDKVTREQLAAILYRYAQYKKYDVSVGEDTNILSYDDAQSISSYAIPAIQWACGAGVVTGKSGSKLDSKGNATRAEVAAMLMRFCENVK